MPDLIPVADAVPGPAAISTAAALRAITGTASGPGDPAGPATLHAVTGALALAVRDLPDLFRRLSGQSGDACTAGQPGRLPAAGSFWFQMEAAADAANRLYLALATAHAALNQDDADPLAPAGKATAS